LKEIGGHTWLAREERLGGSDGFLIWTTVFIPAGINPFCQVVTGALLQPTRPSPTVVIFMI